MQEIRYRGKTRDTNEWILGYYFERDHIIENDEIIYNPKLIVPFNINESTKQVIQDTVGLYIGLKDKNNRDLYPGDIVEYANKYRYIICYGEYNKNLPDSAKAIIVGCYLKSIKSKLIIGDEVSHLYSIDGIAAKFPAHCASDNTQESIDAFKLVKIGNIWDNPELLKEI